LDDAELVKLQGHANDYFVRHARRILQERQSTAAARPLLAMLDEARDPAKRLRAIWALHAIGQAPEDLLLARLADEDPYVRAWAIQLACEGRSPSDAAIAKFEAMAKADASAVVRLYLASALQRIEPARRWEILRGLLAHEQDAADHNLPCLYWYALEPLVSVDKVRALKLAAEGKVPVLREYVARKMTAAAKAQ
jgi:hypothetical protein